MKQVLVKYSEIALKGKNKYEYERQLIKNIKFSAKFFDLTLVNVVTKRNRIICFYENSEDEIRESLSCVFGIKYFSFVEETERSIEGLKRLGKEILSELESKSVSFVTKRGDKSFEVKSPEVNSILGEIANDLGMKVDYKNAEDVVYTDITRDKVYMCAKREEAFGGLPVRTSGRVLVLLSGGIDSPAAAWSMMRRGCSCDFVHFHNLKDNERVKDSKIVETVKLMNKYEFKSTLYIVPFSVYDLLSSRQMYSSYELVFFKYFILKLAERLAIEKGYDAIVTGDNLNQVASQTMDNLQAASFDVDVPIYRPLLTFEKEEIINLSKMIGTYELSIEEYRDCCSLFAKNQTTKAKVEKMQKILKWFDVNSILEKTLKEIETFVVKKD